MLLSKLDCHAMTHVGRARSENEDQFLLADLVKAVRIQKTSLSYDDQAEVAGHSHGKVFLVADGLGGHTAGRRASTLAVDETINYMVDRMRWYYLNEARGKQSQVDSFADDLSSALEHCQQRIQNEAGLNADKKGMATTLTIGIVDWPTLHVVHAGDSRCYLHRDGSLQQLTRDHTLAQVFADDGTLAEGEAGKSSLHDTLWNVVGGKSEQLESEVHQVDLAINDSLLFCTDGLTKHVSDQTIMEVLGRGLSAKQVCEQLVDLALDGGGSDNITVAVAHFLDVDDPAIGRLDAARVDESAPGTTGGTPSPPRKTSAAFPSGHRPVESPRPVGRIEI